jgi:hypothetical protein
MKTAGSLTLNKKSTKMPRVVRSTSMPGEIKSEPDIHLSSVNAEPGVDAASDVTAMLIEGSVEEKICMALAEMKMLGMSAAPRVHVALFSNYTHVRSTGFAKAFSALKDSGMIDFPSRGMVRLTERGQSSTLNKIQPPSGNAETMERLVQVVKRACGKGGGKAGLICQLLRDGQYHSLSKLLKASGYTHVRSTGFAKVLSTLTSLELVQRSKDTIQLADIWFPYGRPSSASTRFIGESVHV